MGRVINGVWRICGQSSKGLGDCGRLENRAWKIGGHYHYQRQQQQ